MPPRAPPRSSARGDACVDPWRYGSPQFDSCVADPRATAESLHDKAAIYDARVMALHDRGAATYIWWGNSFVRGACVTDPTFVQNPAGYLLPYWMGRYYGFIDPGS